MSSMSGAAMFDEMDDSFAGFVILDIYNIPDEQIVEIGDLLTDIGIRISDILNEPILFITHTVSATKEHYPSHIND